MVQRTRAAIRWLSVGLLAAALAAPSLVSARSKPAPANANVVDSGTFSILIDGRKVGTETFTIKQSSEASIASSEIKVDEGATKARQTSEYRIGPKGELQRYEWHELAPEKSEIVVEPQEEFLIEHITSEKDKAFDQPFLMPTTTLVLDDFFFSQREILAWRYLATICKTVNGVNQCVPQKSQFGVIVPRQHSSMVVSIEYVGRDHMLVHGNDQELSHYRITSEESADWDLWLDGNQKLVRILIPATKTTVVRD
ncbi:MAG: hypothetical protein ABSD96_06355 [Candidatus Korobacteraceae bacterium]